MPILMIDGEPIAKVDEGTAQTLLRAASAVQGQLEETKIFASFEPVDPISTSLPSEPPIQFFKTLEVRLLIAFKGHIIRVQEVREP